ncbi:ATP-binding protein [Nonomuraea salmonea]|uniref:ATP-binding protein n=1 Tax=Nonomuraea salmonea TaxID=46181 RepID=UPI0031ED2D71
MISRTWGDVRRLTKALLQDSQVRDDAIMCLMELAANAVLHTRSADGVFTVGIWSAGDAVVRVAVQDAGGWDEPVVRSGQEDLAESGRGLAIVIALAERLGVAGGMRTGGWCGPICRAIRVAPRLGMGSRCWSRPVLSAGPWRGRR